MDSLKDFWTWTFILCFALFAVMTVIVIPLGLRDLFRLLTQLNEDCGNDVDQTEDR